MKRTFSVLLLTLLFSSLFPTIFAVSYTNVTVSEAKIMIDSNPNLMVLDVGDQSEYDSGHIGHSKLIPVTELEGRLGELNQTDEILVYCRSGVRSSTASQILEDNGFQYVYNMLGGIIAWIDAGYSVYVKYSSIQEAVNDASEGDTIYVSSGMYYQYIAVDKTVGLIGEDPETTVICGDGIRAVFTVYSPNVNVTGFTICNGTEGVYLVEGADSCIITDCKILNNSVGAFVESNYSLLTRNFIANNGEAGIRIYSSCSCSPAWENTITDNILLDNGYGLLLMNSKKGLVYHNNLIGNVYQAYVYMPDEWGRTNIWDNGYPSGGNYWSNYAGSDLYSGPYQNVTGSDLMGDTSHVIDENNMDDYPLMGLWTVVGKKVTISPLTEVTLTFENIELAGITIVNKTETGPNPPLGYTLVGKYYNIQTTANYLGKVKVGINYDDSYLTQEEEKALRIMRWNETSQQWINITTSVDTQNNLVFGETSHLSIFVLFIEPPELHDIAVSHVETSETAIEQGYSLFINVTVQNQGDFSETFSLAVYFDSNVIETQSVFLGSGASKTLTFTWDTTDVPIGDYTISAYVSTVPGEIDTADNTKVADNVVTVLSSEHDVAIGNTTSYKTVVGQGFCTSINVTAKNYGSFAEIFNVTAYADPNTTIVGDEITVGIEDVTLQRGGSVTIVLIWNTTYATKGNYTILTEASAVPGEINTTNNAYVDSWVIVAMIGDIIGLQGFPDNKVDMRDVASVAQLFGINNSDEKYNPNCDLTGPTSGLADGKIDMKDIATVAKEFGKTDL